MKKTLLSLLLAGVFIGTHAQKVYTGSLANTDPTFNRPDPGTPPTSLSTVGTNAFYDVIPVVITTPGLVSFTSTSVWDNFAVLYGTAGFDPANPLENALVANDDLAIITFGFTYDFTVPGTYYLVVTSFKNGALGAYTVTASGSVVLPLRLLTFTAEKTNSDVLLKWSTAGEINISKFQVQHSPDGKSFNNLGTAVTARNNNREASYSFTNAAVTPGMHFYRLQMIEKDGSFTLSNIATINNKKPGKGIVKIFPNPTADFVKVAADGGQSGKANISIIGMRGETLYSKNVVLTNEPVSIDVRRLGPGKYFVKTTIDNQETIVSFIKN